MSQIWFIAFVLIGKHRKGLAIAAIAGIILNAVLPGNDYEFGVSESGDQNRGIHP